MKNYQPKTIDLLIFCWLVLKALLCIFQCLKYNLYQSLNTGDNCFWVKEQFSNCLSRQHLMYLHGCSDVVWKEQLKGLMLVSKFVLLLYRILDTPPFSPFGKRSGWSKNDLRLFVCVLEKKWVDLFYAMIKEQWQQVNVVKYVKLLK